MPGANVFSLIGEARKRLKNVKHKVIVLSGKGGVGKTFISSMLALALADKGYNVGILDADIHGSSIPTAYGMENIRLYASEEGILPATGPLGVRVVATNLMLEKPDIPIVWRGPLVSRAIMEFLANVVWGELDYLIIDLPPGTGDEAITIVQVINDLDGAIIVTAPGVLSETVVAKAINFVVKNGIKLLGIVENMSYFKCPKCGEVYYLLGRSTGEELAEKYNTKLLAKIPLDPYIGKAIDKGVPYLIEYPNGDAAQVLKQLAETLVETLEGRK
ncbi:Mrp/NBP35 family ATP-binding protein [Desulfurococcaceae archaeon MEX13E-LK6-19]|nr:Mrp/NBP35 family ATP-binding protein [Desulfurococcaceae archaeon MEX13E-LK6-19]